MNPFTYQRASDAKDAITQVAQTSTGTFLGGGTNLVDLMKLGVADPETIVDVSGLPFNRIEPLPDGGVRLGALVRNSDLAADRISTSSQAPAWRSAKRQPKACG